MMNSTFIDYDKKNVETEVVSDGILIKINEDNGIVGQLIKFSYEEFDKIVDEVRTQTNEKSFEELEQMVIDLAVENEKLKDSLEQQEEYLDHVKEKNFEVF